MRSALRIASAASGLISTSSGRRNTFEMGAFWSGIFDSPTTVPPLTVAQSTTSCSVLGSTSPRAAAHHPARIEDLRQAAIVVAARDEGAQDRAQEHVEAEPEEPDPEASEEQRPHLTR